MNMKKQSGSFFIKTDDDCQLLVRQLKAGNAEIPPVLMIHALAMSAEMWVDTVAAMHTQGNVYAVDCRGHGESQKPAGLYDIDRFSTDMCNVLDYLNISQAVVAGCSMGGTIALGMAGRYPERMAGLVAIDTTAWYGEQAILRWHKRGLQGLTQGMASLANFQCERWFSAEFRASHPEVVTAALEVFMANDPQAYHKSCLMLGRADERAGLAHFDGLTHILVGEHDYATPVSMAADIQKHLPRAVLQVIPKARHYTPMETPGAVAASIDSVLTTVTK